MWQEIKPQTTFLLQIQFSEDESLHCLTLNSLSPFMEAEFKTLMSEYKGYKKEAWEIRKLDLKNKQVFSEKLLDAIKKLDRELPVLFAHPEIEVIGALIDIMTIFYLVNGIQNDPLLASIDKALFDYCKKFEKWLDSDFRMKAVRLATLTSLK